MFGFSIDFLISFRRALACLRFEASLCLPTISRANKNSMTRRYN